MPKLPRLKEIREMKYSQRELAEVPGVSATTIARIESQNITAQPRTMRKLAKALGVEPRELMAAKE